MNKSIFKVFVFVFISTTLNSQVSIANFGKGIQFQDKDSTVYVKMNVRFQNLMSNSWNLPEDNFGSIEGHQSNFLVRRARLKFGGWVYNKKVKYKVELGLSNRDIGGGSGSEFNKTSNLILDAYVNWNFYKGMSIRFGQGKLPGNRERIISSSNLQFVDRSRLNSRFNLDRDVGLMISNKHNLINDFKLIETISLSQGEGRNITTGHHNGYGYTFKIEAFPFGSFESKGDYVGGAIKREQKPKLAIAMAYDINDNAVRERGQKGSFITDNGLYHGKKLYTFFADLMFKFQNISVMMEYADRKTEDNSPIVLNEVDEPIGKFYTGRGFNMQVGYMLKNEYEIAGRYTDVIPESGVGNDEKRYTLGLSKYIVGHNLKIQTDFTYLAVTTQGNGPDQKDDQIIWRTQFELQF